MIYIQARLIYESVKDLSSLWLDLLTETFTRRASHNMLFHRSCSHSTASVQSQDNSPWGDTMLRLDYIASGWAS